MSTIKISELNQITLGSNTSNTILVGVDLPTSVTGKISATSLAQGLYSNNPLNVGANPILFPNTIAQFSGNSVTYLQANFQNFTSSGSADVVLTSDVGTNSNNYIDLGINNSQFSDPNYSSMYPLDGYLYVSGPNSLSHTGNLVIGTASYGANINFIVGGTTSANIGATFNEDWLTFKRPTIINQIPTNSYYATFPALTINNYGNSYSLLVNDDYPSDSSPFAIDNNGNTSIGSLTSYGYTFYVSGNTFFAGNIATSGIITLSDGSNPASNVFVRSNDTITLASAKSYTDVANTFIQNNYVANTNTINLNNLTITGNLVANTVGTSVSFNNVTSNNATFSQNITVNGTLSCNTAQGNVFFSNITTVTSQANTIQWFAQSVAPTQTSGQVWYSANDISLVMDTDIINDRPLLGKAIYERVFNSTGASITGGSWVRLAGAITPNAIPYIVLADATNYANSVVAGFVKNTIANGAYGFIYTTGIVNRLNLSSFNNGDTIFLSTTPGVATNTAPMGANVPVQIAKVLSNDAIMGILQVGIIPQPAWGRTSGSVLYASNNNIVTSNTITIIDATNTVNIAGQIKLSGSITMNNSSFASTSAAVNIIGSANGAIQAPIADGTMLQLTGKDGYNAKVILDSAGASNSTYALFNGRSMRGTAASPSATQAGDTIVRFGGNGYGATGFGSGIGSGGAKMDYVALETYTDTSKGTQILLATTPVGSNALYTVATYAANAINYAQNTALFVSNTIHYTANVNNANVTQLTSKSTAVYANGRTGQITTNNANINKGAAVSFTVYNTYVTSSKDIIILNIASGASVNYAICVNSVTSGSFNVVINNCDGTPSGSNAADTLVINFAIINVT